MRLLTPIALSYAIKRGGHRIDAKNPDASKTKIKFDRQIVAILKTEGANAIYSDDDDIQNYARRAELTIYRTADFDLPPEEP